MREFFNQYSAVIVVGVFALLVASTTGGFRRTKKTLIVVAVMLAVLTLGYFQIRTGPSSVPVAVAVDDVLTGDRPVLMEVYSDFWLICLASKPAVDGLENQLVHQVEVLRINISEPVGQHVARQHLVRVTPTFIVFSPGGTEVYRQAGGFPDTLRLVREIQNAD